MKRFIFSIIILIILIILFISFKSSTFLEKFEYNEDPNKPGHLLSAAKKMIENSNEKDNKIIFEKQCEKIKDKVTQAGKLINKIENGPSKNSLLKTLAEVRASAAAKRCRF